MSGDGDATGDFSAIVAYEATRREKTNVLMFLRDEMMLKWEMFVGFFFLTKIFQTITSVLTPLSKQITIVLGGGTSNKTAVQQ